MKIAITHKLGEVFEHFGHTTQFKIYEVEDNKVASSKVVATMASGHDALSRLLNTFGADTLLCGGIGPGAISALESTGVKVIPGCSGNCDDVVEAFLAGTLSPEENFHKNHGGHCGC